MLVPMPRSEDLPAPLSHGESTAAVVIGTGLSGLAVAAELNRHGVLATTLGGLESASPSTATSPLRVADLSSAESAEYLDVLRHVRKYAVSHALDVRHHVHARHLALVEPAESDSGDRGAVRWAVRTDDGVLFADAVVLTRCAHNQLRRFLADLGYSLGENLMTALAEIGLYLIGVAELEAPSTRDLVRQAKSVGAEVAGRIAGLSADGRGGGSGGPDGGERRTA